MMPLDGYARSFLGTNTPSTVLNPVGCVRREKGMVTVKIEEMCGERQTKLWVACA
jgi:hypothetical protein